MSASPSASSIASERLLRLCGRLSVSTATLAMSSRKRISEEAAAAAAAAGWVFIGSVLGPVLPCGLANRPPALYPICMAGSRGMKHMAAPKLTVKELERLLSAEFPQMFNAQSGYGIEEVWSRRLPGSQAFQSAIAASRRDDCGPDDDDAGRFCALCRDPGDDRLGADGGDHSIFPSTFSRSRQPRDLLAEARLIKLGKRLAVGEIGIRSEGEDDLVAHATVDLFDSARRGEIIPQSQILEILAK